MSGPVLAILLTLVVHIIGGALLIWALAGADLWRMFSTRPGDDDGGTPPPPPRAPEPAGPRDGLPLPHAAPARVRVRGPHRRPRPVPARRPSHVPDRAPERV